ncbi:MAG: hypothetical protein CL424_18990 [Acidimicrobiaceae bacterium]|nr:hypothetical protein [Acidimicrobiaceae bacterium]
MPVLERVLTTNSPAARVSVLPGDGTDVSYSFVFVTFGTGAIVVDAIESVVRSMDASAATYEIVVVDNPHPEAPGTSRRELALSTRGVRVLVATHNLGFAGGCELGALHARGRYLVFLNPDVVVPDGWLEPLVSSVDAGASIAAPMLVHPGGRVQEVGARLDAGGGTHPWLDPAAVASGAAVPDYASAACWVMARDEHERLGGFDAGYFPAFYEDVDLALRAGASGGRIEIVSDVAVTHHRGSGSRRSNGPPDTSDQRDRLLATHPSIRWTRERRSSTNDW